MASKLLTALLCATAIDALPQGGIRQALRDATLQRKTHKNAAAARKTHNNAAGRQSAISRSASTTTTRR